MWVKRKNSPGFIPRLRRGPVTIGLSVYAYLALSAAVFAVWLVLYAVRSDIRRQMVWVGVGTMFLGLTEPLFVPEYWNPPTLWDLARRTGFDLESLLFSFAIGGIVFAAHNVIFRVALSESVAHERSHPRHRYHVLAVLSAPIVFVILLALTSLNPIYAAAVALVARLLWMPWDALLRSEELAALDRRAEPEGRIT